MTSSKSLLTSLFDIYYTLCMLVLIMVGVLVILTLGLLRCRLFNWCVLTNCLNSQFVVMTEMHITHIFTRKNHSDPWAIKTKNEHSDTWIPEESPMHPQPVLTLGCLDVES